MKAFMKTGSIFLIVCLMFVSPVCAEAVIDADYSAAILSVMSEGNVPEEQIVEAVSDQTIQEIAIQKEVYTTDVLAVRKLPGTTYEEIAKLAKYAKVQVIGVCDNGWSRVQMEDGQIGYVCNEFLSDIVPEGAENIGESLGVFTVTYYCACEICCGWWSGSPTASGAYPVADWTVAADPEVLPLGTHIYISGHEYCVEDTGSGVDGQHVDIYVTDHELAVNNGIGYAEVFASK
ncbi:MAG: 3D domain-containing protein [Eubacteriales bacterium]|nr:3D domain-containing protein [Eubacteriales bacterium]